MIATLTSALVVSGWLAFDPLALEIPGDWKVERPPPYPSLLASFSHRSGATLTIGRQYLGVGEDGESFARGNLAVMESMGITAQRTGDRIEAWSPDTDQRMLQVYIVRGTVGWVVTLSGPPSVLTRLKRDVGTVVAQIRAP